MFGGDRATRMIEATGHADYLDETLQEGGRTQLPYEAPADTTFDEKVVTSFRRIVGETPMEVANEYEGYATNDRGLDNMLEQFIVRNVDYMSRRQVDQLSRQHQMCNQLARMTYEDQSVDYAVKLKDLLRNKVYPMIRDITKYKNQQKYAEERVDPLPSDLKPADYGSAHKVGASAAGHRQDIYNQVRWAISETMKNSAERGAVISAENARDATVNPGVSADLRVQRALVKSLLLQRKLWVRYSSQHENLLESEVANISKSVNDAQTKLIKLEQQLHGHGYAAAVSHGMGRRETLTERKSIFKPSKRPGSEVSSDDSTFLGGGRKARAVGRESPVMMRLRGGGGQPSPSPDRDSFSDSDIEVDLTRTRSREKPKPKPEEYVHIKDILGRKRDVLDELEFALGFQAIGRSSDAPSRFKSGRLRGCRQNSRRSTSVHCERSRGFAQVR